MAVYAHKEADKPTDAQGMILDDHGGRKSTWKVLG